MDHLRSGLITVVGERDGKCHHIGQGIVRLIRLQIRVGDLTVAQPMSKTELRVERIGSEFCIYLLCVFVVIRHVR